MEVSDGNCDKIQDSDRTAVAGKERNGNSNKIEPKGKSGKGKSPVWAGKQRPAGSNNNNAVFKEPVSITVPNMNKTKGKIAVPGTSSDSVSMGGHQHTLSLVEQFDQVDSEFAADHVQLMVDSAEERQFTSNDEDAPTESLEDGTNSESETDSESESEDGNVFPENDDLVDSSDSVSQVMAPSKMSSGVVTFKQNLNKYSNLHNDPAFVAYIKSLVLQEMEAERANLKKG